MKSGTCERGPRGWYCARDRWHTGPCALWPRWWNLMEVLRGRGYIPYPVPPEQDRSAGEQK